MSQSGTYRAIQVTEPGKFELVERAVTEPPPAKVRIRVEACGVSHSDVLTVQGVFPGISYPRVPGHEVIGKIDALGGGRVGVGYLSGPCFRCEPCQRGDFVNCENQGITGVSSDGRYADAMMAGEEGVVGDPWRGALTGSAIGAADTLAFSVLETVRPMIETVSLENAVEAYARIMRGYARFRMVLVTGN